MMEKRGVKVAVGSVLFVVMAALALSAAEKAKSPVEITVVTDRPDAMYRVGEKATFAVEVKLNGQPVGDKEASYQLSLDGAGDLGKGVLKLAQGKATVSGSLDKPGILRCMVWYSPSGERGLGLAGAAYEPFKIQPTAVVPADFDEFWNAQKAELAKIPMDAKLEPVSQADDKIEVFKLTMPNIGGSRIRAYLAKPKGPGPFPAILSIPGASFSGISPGWATGHAAQGFLSIAVGVHDIESGQPPEYYDKLRTTALLDYPKQGREDRMTYYFRRVILGNVRAVDYVTSRPEWNKKHMIVNGSSQGGGLSLVAAGLDSRITALASNVPGLCDHNGRAFGRPAGWPRVVPDGPDGKLDPKILQVAAYYDAVTFARKITVPAIMGVGLIDSTCPATTNFSAYNLLRGPKQIDIAPLMGHAVGKSYTAMKERWVLEQAGLKK